MTAQTSQMLANVLRSAGFEELAVRAENDEFNDFKSSHVFPELALDRELVLIVMTPEKYNKAQRIAAKSIRIRLHSGEFDASLEESDEWAQSPDGQAAFDMLKRDLDKGK